jgi:hypothetical protein
MVVTPSAGWGSVPGASWVSVDADRGGLLGPNHHGVAGDFTYQFVFCVCRPQGVSLTLSFLAKNSATVKLNGVGIYNTTGDDNFQSPPRVVNYAGAFLTMGTNTLLIVVHNSASVTGLAANLRVIGGAAGACPKPTCPNLRLGYQSRANSSVVNVSLSLTNVGPGTASNVTVTDISCTNGYVYKPQRGLSTIPFIIPGTANLPMGGTIGFNLFLQKAGRSQTGPFSCTIAYTDPGGTCKGQQLVVVP